MEYYKCPLGESGECLLYYKCSNTPYENPCWNADEVYNDQGQIVDYIQHNEED